MTAGSFLTDDGCRIVYDYQPRADAPVLLMSPSLGTAMALFDAQVEALGSHYSILRYDMRGHGASDAPEGGYAMDRLGRDVVELLDHLEIAKVHFLGVSLGGMTGQWLGYRAPERIDRLILANTSAYMGPPAGWADRIAAVLENGMEPMVEPVLERWFTPDFRESGDAEVVKIGQLLERTKAAGYAGCSAAIRDMDMRPILPLISVPTLVVAGLKDPATPPEHAQYLANNIPDASLVELNAAHLSNVELPDEFSDAVRNFLGVPS